MAAFANFWTIWEEGTELAGSSRGLLIRPEQAPFRAAS